MSIGIFLPVRKGSERIKNKNLRRFADRQNGLLEVKLRQLIELKEVQEIVVSTDDRQAEAVALDFQKVDKRIKIDIRPDHLASSTTDLNDLIEYVPKIISSENILWTHVTSPCCDETEYKKAIKEFDQAINSGFDSLVSGNNFQNYLYDQEKKGLINRVGEKIWPHTQDLKPLFEINNAIFLAPRRIYIENKNRMGKFPLFYTMNKIASLDIDEEEDFKMTEAVYERFFR